MDEFYRKACKYLKLEDSKEALHKAEGAAANKKNDPRIVLDNRKGQDKRRGEDKRAKSLKKQRAVRWKTEAHPRNTPIIISTS